MGVNVVAAAQVKMWLTIEDFDNRSIHCATVTNVTNKKMWGEIVQAEDNPGWLTAMRRLTTWSMHWVTVGNVTSQGMWGEIVQPWDNPGWATMVDRRRMSVATIVTRVDIIPATASRQNKKILSFCIIGVRFYFRLFLCVCSGVYNLTYLFILTILVFEKFSFDGLK